MSCKDCNTYCSEAGTEGKMCMAWTKKPKSNADAIRAMTDEELAKIITDDWCELLHCETSVGCAGDCELRVLNWLKEETNG